MLLIDALKMLHDKGGYIFNAKSNSKIFFLEKNEAATDRPFHLYSISEDLEKKELEKEITPSLLFSNSDWEWRETKPEYKRGYY